VWSQAWDLASLVSALSLLHVPLYCVFLPEVSLPVDGRLARLSNLRINAFTDYWLAWTKRTVSFSFPSQARRQSKEAGVANKEKRVVASLEGRALSREQLTRPIPAELSLDTVGNRWVLKYLVANKGLTLKILVKAAGMEDAYEYEIWQGADRILSSSEAEWYHRMRAEFADCIKVFDGMRQRWLLQRDATDSAWRDFFPKAESYGSGKLSKKADTYSRWAEGMQREFGEVLERASKISRGLVMESIEVIASAVEAKDPFTLGHSQRVARYAVILAKGIGLPEQEVETIRISAILHDVGKIGIEARLLRKPGALTNEEFEIVKRHTLLGFEMVRQVKELQDMLPVIRSHHERYDGKGYPDGLAGDRIPSGARIVAVANSLDFMTCELPHRRALPLAEVRERIRREAGKQFDPEVVRVFLATPDEVWNSVLRTTE
jgi:putative nucleotidyltransferase with HDIG domain